MDRRDGQQLAVAARHRSSAGQAVMVMAIFVGLLWLVQISDQLASYPLLRYGIFPRSVGRIEDIASAPFIHANYSHLIGNTLPLLVLGFLVALGGLRRFFAVTVLVIVVSGLGVWLTAPSGSDTVGVSGVIFGYLGYLVTRGFVERRLVDLFIAIIVGVLYWSIVPDLLPGHPGVSWQGHLFGLLGGVLAAFLLRRRSAEQQIATAPTSSGASGPSPA
jgi:membrane associated rhomboid family serine protease